MKRSSARTTGMLAVSTLIAVFAVAPVAFAADGDVNLCHATNSYKNPYELKSIPPAAVITEGHGNHIGPIFDPNGGKKQVRWGDIIPVFSGYPGLNVADGQAWLDRQCKRPAPTAPAILLEKTASLVGDNGNGVADLGESIAYSFLVTNMGNVTLTHVAVTDDMSEIGAVTCLADSLVPTASTTCTAASAYTVTLADIDQRGPIVNTANAYGQPPTGGPVTDMGTVSTQIQEPAVAPDTLAISVVKTATLNDVAGNTAGKADAGETIMYSFLVTNTGSVTLSGVAVTDSKLASPIVCDPTELAPTAHVTCTTAAYLVTASDVEAGAPILNTATATGMGPDESTATATDTASTPTQKPSVDSVVPVVPTVPGDPTVQPKITLKAAVVNDVGGTAQVSDFTLTGSSTQVAFAAAVQNSAAMVASAVATSFSGVTGDAAITNAVVPVGTYSLSESALPLGYSASAWACTGGQLNGSAITVTFGNTVECVITNTYRSTAVDSPGVPTAGPASPPPALLRVEKTAPRATTPAATTPAATTLAFTGAETVPLSLLALLALVLGAALTVAGRRQGGQRARG